jgi:predicted esterase
MSVFLALCLFLAIASDTTWGEIPSSLSTSPLMSEVMEYLDTTDPDKATTLLDTLLASPGADLSTIEAALRTGRPYSPQPVGLQPDLSMQVAGRSAPYGLWVPLTYDPSRAYPLVICLHGAGFTGDAYLSRWHERLGEKYLVACPTIAGGAWWTRSAERQVLTLIRFLVATYHVDPDRVFLTGMSNGGIGAYLIGMHHADLFAGIAPMASGIDTPLMPFLANVRNTPVYLIHGKEDEVMPVRLSRQIAAELKTLGYPFVYREHDRTHPVAGGHFFPREELPALITWFDQQRRHVPIHVTVVRDASHLTAFSWARIDATDRIAAFRDNLTDSRDADVVNRIYAKLDAVVTAPNRIEVTTDRIQRYSLFLNEQLVDFSKPVTIVTNQRVSFEGMVIPSARVLLREARFRRDASAGYPAVVSVIVQP